VRGLGNVSDSKTRLCNFVQRLGQVINVVNAGVEPSSEPGRIRVGLASVFRPVLPWVGGERVPSVRVKKFRKFPALLDAKARTNPDVLQSTGVVKQAEEQ
jgi:hypothetical protein